MSKEKTTADKSNAYKVRFRISQAIFKELIEQQDGEELKHTAMACVNRPMLSTLSNIATNAIMKDPRLNVVLRKG